MKLTQLKTILDTVNSELFDTVDADGEVVAAVQVKEDLSNIVDVGKQVLDFTGSSNENFEKYMGKLIDQVGKQVFESRVYSSQAPKILKDSWEYGSIMQKVRASLPDVSENKTWDLASMSNGDTLDPFVITKPDVEAKFYNSKTTFEIPITIARRQLESAMKSASALNSFIAMIENRIALKATLCTDALIMRTINNLMAVKIHNGENVVDLRAAYNSFAGTNLTVQQCLNSKEFLAFSAKTMLLFKKYLSVPSNLYNTGEYVTFTNPDQLKVVVLADFAKNMETILYSNTYHNEFVQLPGYEEVPYWQNNAGATTPAKDGDPVSQTVNDFATISKINVTATDGETTFEVAQSGIVGVMFDNEAAAVCNEDVRTTSIYNPRGEYTNFFHKFDAAYLNDTAENCVVFVIK